MDKIKIIFLDVDGVLNNATTKRRTSEGFVFVDKKHIKNLKKIIDSTGAKVVLSSDWRFDRYDPEYNKSYLELEHELSKYGIEFYGFTPELPGARRGQEIEQWINDHGEIESFVILDDRKDMEPYMDNLVRTDYIHGLSSDDANKAIEILMV